MIYNMTKKCYQLPDGLLLVLGVKVHERVGDKFFSSWKVVLQLVKCYRRMHKKCWILKKGLKMLNIVYKCSKMINLLLVSWYHTQTLLCYDKNDWRVIKAAILKKTNFQLFFTKIAAVSIIFEDFCMNLLLRRLIKIYSSYNSLRVETR